MYNEEEITYIDPHKRPKIENKIHSKCKDKQCYSKNEVKNVKKSVMRRRNRKIRYYECDICYNFHITSNINNM